MAEQEQAVTPTKLRFVVTVEGAIHEAGTLKVEAFKLAEDGTLIETAPEKTQDVPDGVLVALNHAGEFLQSISISMGISIAVASGDSLTAMSLLAVARRLGLDVTPSALAGAELLATKLEAAEAAEAEATS